MDANDTRSGGPAFPFEHGHSPDAANVRECGMSLRDWFAGQALAGMMACESEDFCITGDAQHTVEEKRAKAAYEQADAMIAAR